MERFDSVLSNEEASMMNALAFLPSPHDKLCFFDIETTGLSPKVSSLYLIGAVILDQKTFRLTQWFADDYTSEEQILLAFKEFCSSCDVYVHYNGSSFDIPYLEKKYKTYHISSPFSEKKSIDLLHRLPKDRTFLGTKSYRLTEVEKLLSFQREDCFSGKDCIRLYTDFMQLKYFRDPLAEKKKRQLLLHNHDDLLGTILCGQLSAFCSGQFSALSIKSLSDDSGKALRLSARLDAGFFPFSITRNIVSKNGLTFRYHCDKNLFSIDIPLYEGELYHFFKDYKNYYYLENEDEAVHKSVGSYVDKQFRKPATASTCYIRRKDLFFPLPALKRIPEDILSPDLYPVFCKGYKSREYYITASSALSMSGEMLTGLFSLYL